MTARVSKLPSGLTIVTDRMPHLKTASLGIWAGAGSRHEDTDEHGISHLLEHMAFKGTRRRSARQIVEEIEAVGGDLNASTGVEATGYYARVLGADVPLALDILTDILTEPTFDPQELAREQGVIVQEIGASNDTPEDVVFDLFQARAFPEQSIGRPILGTANSVRSFTPERLRSYLGKHYRAPRMIVAAAGDVDHDAIVADVEKRLAAIPAVAGVSAQSARYAGGLELGTRKLEQAHVVLGLQGCSYLAPGFYALQVFTNVLGGGSSSRLFQEVREKRGLCYSIYAYHQSFFDTGIFGVYAGTDPADTRDLMAVVVDELAGAAATANEAEIGRAKALMKVGLLGMLESSSARADQLGRQILAFGRPIPLEELAAKIDAVTLADVRAAGGALIASGRPTFAGLGPRAGLESAARIAESLERRAA
jgi:predicted Zn-dependent peptidase